MNIGSIVSGRVTRLAAFGAFVALEDGQNGMIHISELSSGFVRDVGEILTVGQSVRVKLLRIDEAGRISLSLRAAIAEEGAKSPPIEYTAPSTSGDFEDMLSRFKARSDDKLADSRRRAKRRE